MAGWSDHMTPEHYEDDEELREMKLEPIQKQRVYQNIIEQFKKSIERGELKPGDRIPSERELAEELNVSRSAVREAISVLEAARLVRILPGVGMFLEEDPNKDVMARLNEILQGSNASLVQLLEVRQAIESQAAYLAALRRTDADLKKLQMKFEALKQSVENNGIAAEEDYEFHLAIVESAYNPMLMETLKIFSDQWRSGVHKSRSQSISIPGRSLIVLEEHRKIYQAIADKDSIGAQQAMWEHIHHVKSRYLT